MYRRYEAHTQDGMMFMTGEDGDVVSKTDHYSEWTHRIFRENYVGSAAFTGLVPPL